MGKLDRLKFWRRKDKAAKAATKRRKARRAADLRLLSDFTPPEGVPLKFEVAGVGPRLGAQLLDILLTGLLVAAFLFVLSFISDFYGELLLAVGSLLFFAIRAPYYVLAELLWNGVTIGKRIMKIRVISADGRSLTPHSIVVRNLMKEVEIFVPGVMLLATDNTDWVQGLITLVWTGIVLGVPLFNRRRRRLGDMIAGTCVVMTPAPILMPDLTAKQKTDDRFVFQPHQLDHYGAYELQTLETLLRANNNRVTNHQDQKRRMETEQAVATRIREKIDYAERVTEAEAHAFLSAFYTAQRAHLERRQLFGEKREDKFHKEDT